MLRWLATARDYLRLLFSLFRWGFIQFSTDAVNTTQFVRTRNWPAYSALVMLYEAEKVICRIFSTMQQGMRRSCKTIERRMRRGCKIIDKCTSRACKFISNARARRAKLSENTRVVRAKVSKNARAEKGKLFKTHELGGQN